VIINEHIVSGYFCKTRILLCLIIAGFLGVVADWFWLLLITLVFVSDEFYALWNNFTHTDFGDKMVLSGNEKLKAVQQSLFMASISGLLVVALAVLVKCLRVFVFSS
jgi:hypothetical protein